MSKLPLLFKQINAFSKQHNLIPDNARIVIGLSGGPDSVFLAHFLASLKKLQSIDIIAAYLDHQWRQESAQDAQFCADLCAKLGISFVSATISELNLHITNNGSKEAFARKARRFFFEQVRNQYDATAIALAHHAQDQQETFFIRLIRGAGTAGLAAIYPKAAIYIRPLLETNKSDIVNYLTQHEIPFLTDPTNTSLNFLRNRIRHFVIPALHATDQRFDHNFQRTVHNLHTTEQFLANITESIFSQITATTQAHNKIMLNSILFQQQHPLIQHRIVMHLLIIEQVPFTPTQHFVQEIIRFIATPHTSIHAKQYSATTARFGSKSKSTKIHRMHPTWQLVKNGVFVFVEKYSNK